MRREPPSYNTLECAGRPRAYLADRFRVRRKKERCTWAIRSRSDPLARCVASEKMKMQAGLERRKSYAHLDARSNFLSLSAPSGEGAARNARLRRRLRSRPKIP